MTTITIRDGLAFLSVTVVANGKELQISDVLLDTGAAATAFKTDILETLGVIPSPSDQIRFMSGVGGREAVIEKQIERLTVGNLSLSPFTMQMGAMDYGIEINGILGIDFLLATGAIIDLHALTIS